MVNNRHGWDEVTAPTNFPGISKEARLNRRILITAMSKAGFTNYLGEWWHWSYGDSAWAVRIGRGTAIYGRVDGLPTNDPPLCTSEAPSG